MRRASLARVRFTDMLLKNVLSASARVVPLFGHYVLYFLSCTMGNAASVYYSRCKGAGPYLATHEVFWTELLPAPPTPTRTPSVQRPAFYNIWVRGLKGPICLDVAAAISISGECRDSDAGDVGCCERIKSAGNCECSSFRICQWVKLEPWRYVLRNVESSYSCSTLVFSHKVIFKNMNLLN